MPKRSSVKLALPLLVLAAIGRCGAGGRSQQQVSSVASASSNSAQTQSTEVARKDAPQASGLVSKPLPRERTTRPERARSDSPASSTKVRSAEPTLTPKQVARIKRQLIQQSIDDYAGSCPCPYNVARNGSSCGRRSAYSRPGGAAPLCYPGDVSDEMVTAAWEAELAQ